MLTYESKSQVVQFTISELSQDSKHGISIKLVQFNDDAARFWRSKFQEIELC